MGRIKCYKIMSYHPDIVDPNRDGYVSLQEYMAFMISKETENVQSSEEIENAFRAITNGERPYVTKEELYAVSLSVAFFKNIIGKKNLTLLTFLEPHERNGRLLCFAYESLRRFQVRETGAGRVRLYGLYPNLIPKLTHFLRILTVV